MTAYLTAVGVQQVSITIASGSLTGTATITSVGSGAFILWRGENPSDTAIQLDDTRARVELTNSTTVTATRGVTGTSQTIVVKAVVIDGDTTNLIKSVQSGTISIAAGVSSGTATVSAVTNANAAPAYLGQSWGATSGQAAADCIVSLSGTTVTATANSAAPSGGIVVGYCVIEFQGSALNSAVQNVAYSAVSSSSSDTVTITSVNTANTFLIYGGMNGSSNAQARVCQQYGKLTNATTFTTTWSLATSATRRYNCCVVEFAAGVLNQSVQRGTIALAAATSNTATITSSSTTNGFVNWLGNDTNLASTQPAITEYAITQTNATTLTMTANTAATGTGSYEVVEFSSAAAVAFTGNNLWFSMDGL